jgi:hypothetical protein
MLPPSADRLNRGIFAGMGLVVFVAGALLGMLLDIGARSGRYYPEPAALVKILGVSDLAVVPSGQHLRHPLLRNRVVDLRYDPRLAFEPLHAAELLLAPEAGGAEE